MARVRLLLVNDEMEVGGTQRQIVNLARSLDRDRYAPTVLYFRNPSSLVGELEESGVPVFQIPKRGPIDFAFLGALRAFLARGRFDVIHAFSFTGELWVTLARLLAPRAALVTSIRSVYDWYTGPQWAAKRWVTRRSQLVVANSEVAARYTESRLGLPEGAIRVVYNGTALPEPAAAEERERERAELGIEPGTVAALFVGRLVPLKNVPVLLRAVARLGDGARLLLLVAGDGPARSALENEARNLGLGTRVRFLGNRPDGRRLMEAADIIVLPSFQEGLSNAILEAMAAGRPVVASRVGGNGELVEEGATGLLFPSDDAEALAGCLARLGGDAALRASLGAEGRRVVASRFGLEPMARSMERIYEECVA
jgi:glycosyltransferase involved in cell wall biosynthesis